MRPTTDVVMRAMAQRPRVYVALFASALVLRLVWVLVVDRDGFAWNDPLQYHVQALGVSQGLGFTPLDGGPTARWPPGYSTVLGGVYVVAGPHPLAGEIVNALIGAATVPMLMAVVRPVVGWPSAVVAGAMFAVLPGPILWTDLLVSETLFTALFVLFYLLLVRARATFTWMVVLGAAIGLGTLVRGEAITWGLLPIVAFWSELPKLELAKKVTAAAATAIVVLLPWTIRNAVVMDAFVPVATNASQTLWAGHNPDATGGQVYVSPEYEAQFTGTPRERELEMSSAMRNDALEYMITHPVRELELIPLKLLHLNRGDSYALDWVNDVPASETPPLSEVWVERIGVVADVAYYGLLTLTIIAGFVLGREFWRSRLGRCMTASFITALVLYGFVYYGNYRYRLPYEPLMVIAAATLLTRIWSARRALRTTDPEPTQNASVS